MTTQLIGSALDRVVNSKTFSRSRSLQDFLTFIVTQSLEPDQNLKEYRIGVDALKRGGAFDPAENSIVRVQAYRLRAKLADYYQHEGQAEDVRIDLEPGSYTPVIRECASSPRCAPFASRPGPRPSALRAPLPASPDARRRGIPVYRALLRARCTCFAPAFATAIPPARAGCISNRVSGSFERPVRHSRHYLLSDADTQRVIWSQAHFRIPRLCLICRTWRKRGSRLLKQLWRHIDAVLSCNG